MTTTPTPSAAGLPPLPEPLGLVCGTTYNPPKPREFFGTVTGHVPDNKCDVFTADQMQAYALAALAALPQPPVRPDRKATSYLINLAAWLLTGGPTRPIDLLEENTHIGHRQFSRAHEQMHEALRLKAIEIRNFADGLASAPQPAAKPSVDLAASEGGGVTQWQPIETAPRDGTLVLIREPRRCSGLAAMFWGGWKYEFGGICYLEPTHWMPLPAAPTGDGA